MSLLFITVIFLFISCSDKGQDNRNKIYNIWESYQNIKNDFNYFENTQKIFFEKEKKFVEILDQYRNFQKLTKVIEDSILKIRPLINDDEKYKYEKIFINNIFLATSILNNLYKELISLTKKKSEIQYKIDEIKELEQTQILKFNIYTSIDIKFRFRELVYLKEQESRIFDTCSEWMNDLEKAHRVIDSFSKDIMF